MEIEHFSKNSVTKVVSSGVECIPMKFSWQPLHAMLSPASNATATALSFSLIIPVFVIMATISLPPFSTAYFLASSVLIDIV